MKDILVHKGDFITIVAKKDLTPGYKAAQSVHAIAEFAVEHEQEFKEWQCNSNYICCLETSQCGLDRLINRLDLLKIKYTKFFEPDIGNVLTAIAVEALSRKEHKQLFKNFKLTLS